jgi:transcriptional regulator with XRE-family HTH domain
MISEPNADDIRNFRAGLGLTKADFAGKISSAVRTVEDWEAGRRKAPAMLRLAMGAVARGLQPWRPMPALGPTSGVKDVLREAKRLFDEQGDDYAAMIEDEFRRSLADDATPAEMLLYAHVMRLNDGYNRAEVYENWASRPKAGWHTVVAFRPDLEVATPTLGFETRLDNVAKQLAVFVDQHRPGERLPEKVQVETALLERGVRVVSFSATDVLVDCENCKATIETVIEEIAGEVLHEAGKIERAWKRPERR